MKNQPYNLYWGILHCHITGDLCHKKDAFTDEELEETARQIDDMYAWVQRDRAFDFFVYSDHHNMGGMIEAGYTERSPWKIVSDKADEHNREGEFIALKGYEFQDGTEYNVYLYDTDRLPLASRWQEILADVAPNEHGVLLAAHNRPRPTDWSFPHHPNCRLVEIINDSGNPFEGWANTGLLAGHKCGFISGSDDHGGRPGKKACTGVWAESLSSEGIWNGLWKRRLIATTGIRPELWFSMDESPLGTMLSGSSSRRMYVSHRFERTPLLVMVIKNGELYTQFQPSYGCFEETVLDDTADRVFPFDYYYVKVYYPDGHIAYASPVWCQNVSDITSKSIRVPEKSEALKPLRRQCVQEKEIGSRIGYHRFINADPLLARHSDLKCSRSVRDMLTHVGSDSLLCTASDTIIHPAMDGIYERIEGAEPALLYAFGEDEYRLLLTSYVEIDNSVIGAGYHDGAAAVRVFRGSEPDMTERLEPIRPYIFGKRYVTPQYLASDGIFLYVLGERELFVMLSDGRVVGTCQDNYPAFPCAVTAGSLGEIYVLSCDGRLCKYSMATTQHGVCQWEKFLPRRFCSLLWTGDELWVYNEKIDILAPRQTWVAVYTPDGTYEGCFDLGVTNITGTAIAKINENRFAALHNPNTEPSAAFRDQLNESGVIRMQRCPLAE